MVTVTSCKAAVVTRLTGSCHQRGSGREITGRTHFLFLFLNDAANAVPDQPEYVSHSSEKHQKARRAFSEMEGIGEL
jgi:hypothetical protein